MDEHPRHAQRIGHQAGMLTTGTTKTAQGVFGHIMAALHRDALDRFGHIADRDADEALGHLLGCALIAGGSTNLRRQFGKARAHHLGIQRLVALRAEHFREELRLHLAQHDIGIGHGERTAAPVAGRPGIGPGRVRPDAIARAIEMQDRAATRRNGVNAHHRRTHAHPGHLGVELALQITQTAAGEVRHIG